MILHSACRRISMPFLLLALLLLLIVFAPRPLTAQPPTLTVDEALVAVYTGMYQRAPDLEGLQFWRDVVAAQFGFGPQDPVTGLGFMRQMTAQFGQFPTFAVLYLGLDDAAFVTAIYNNVAGRDPDPEGLAYWVGRLGGTIPGEAPVSRTEMIADFIFGTLMTDLEDPAFVGLTPEQRAAAQGAQDTARNRVLVGAYFVERLAMSSNLGLDGPLPSFNDDPTSPTYVEDAAALQAFLETLETFNASTQALAGVTDDPATVGQAMAWIDALNPIYAFEIGLQGTGLKVSFSEGEAGMIQPEVPLRGEYTCNALLDSCTFDKVNEGRILLDDTGLIGMDLLTEIRVPLIFPPDQNQALLPTQGSLEVQWPADAPLAQRNRTVLSFTACDPTVPNITKVEAQYFEPPEPQYADRLCLSFQEFDDLDLAGEALDWVVYAFWHRSDGRTPRTG